MSGDDVMSDEAAASKQAVPDGFDSWNGYWAKQGMAWRTEPEISLERRAYLRQRCAVAPNIEQGIYPFRNEQDGIALTRADVEWLLATHHRDGAPGPIDAEGAAQQWREGLDLRGAHLQDTDLSHLPLTRVCGGMPYKFWNTTTEEQRERASVHLEGSNLQHASLQNASLRRAHLENAQLRGANLEDTDFHRARMQRVFMTQVVLRGANLQWAHLEGAWMYQTDFSETNMQGILFDVTSDPEGCTLGTLGHRAAQVADIRWNGVNLSSMQWASVRMLGDEQLAMRRRTPEGHRKSRAQRTREYETADRANRQLAITLRMQGFHEYADRFAYRAQLMQRVVLRRQRHYLRYFGSLLLDVLAGYGYRPGRSILVYLAVILWFANFYVWASHGLFSLGLPTSQVHPLQWYEALILSVSSFHGRGFQPFQHLNDPIAALAGMQAVFGLIIEVSFIATFTQRFFAR